MMRAPHRLTPCLAAALVSALASSTAVAADSGPHGPTTFSGSCQGSGTVAFKPPLTNTPRPTTQRARGVLACSGSLIDRRGRTHQLTDARVVYRATERGDDISCGAGVDSGSGTLRFHWGALHFTVEEKRAAAVATLAYTGAKGGSATGVAHPTGDPATAVQQCAGSGIKRTTVDLTLSADSLSG